MWGASLTSCLATLVPKELKAAGTGSLPSPFPLQCCCPCRAQALHSLFDPNAGTRSCSLHGFSRGSILTNKHRAARGVHFPARQPGPVTSW